MRKTATFAFVTLAATALAGCGAGGILNRERPSTPFTGLRRIGRKG